MACSPRRLQVFKDYQDLMGNSEFQQEVDYIYDSTPELRRLGSRKQYTEYVAKVNFGILPNPVTNSYNNYPPTDDDIDDYVGSLEDINGFERYVYKGLNLTPIVDESSFRYNKENLKKAVKNEIKRLRQESSRLKTQANAIDATKSDAKVKIAQIFTKRKSIEDRINLLTIRQNIYNEYDYDKIQNEFDKDIRRLEILSKRTNDLQQNLRNIKEAQRIVDFYSEIGDFSRSENYLFEDTSIVPDTVRNFFQRLANEVEPYNATINDLQKEITLDVAKSVPSLMNYLQKNKITLSYEFLTRPVKDKDWLSLQTLSSEDNFLSEQVLLIDILMQYAEQYEDAAIKQRRDVIKMLDDKIKAIQGKHNAYNEFKQLDKNGEFTKDIIMPFSQSFFDTRATFKFKRINSIKKLKSKEELTPKDKKRINKLSTELREWDLKNEIMINLVKLPEVNEVFPNLVSGFYTQYSDAEMKAYKQMIINNVGEKGYKKYIEKILNHLKEYSILEEYMTEQANEDLEGFLQTLDLKEGIIVATPEDAMNIWKALHSPFHAVDAHYRIKDSVININDKPYYLQEITNLRDSHYRYTESIPRKYKGSLSKEGDYYVVEDTNEITGYYDERFKVIENDDALYDFWSFAIHNLGLAKQMMPYRYQRLYQKNTILFVEKSVMEQFTADKSFGTVYSAAWDSFINSLTDAELATETFSDDIFGSNERNINYSFLGTRQQQEDKLYESKVLEYFIKNGIDAVSIADAKDKGIYDFFSYEVQNELYNLRKEARKEVAERASFDLGAVLKFYLGTMIALNHKENILPLLNNIESEIKKIKKVETNRQGKVLTTEEGVKVTDLPITNAIERVGYQLDVFAGKPSQLVEGTSKKKLYTVEENKIIDNLKKLKEEAKEESQKNAIQEIIDSYGKYVTMSGSADTLLTYLRFKGLGWNVAAQVPNAAAGYFANFAVAADARLVKTSNLQRAYNIFFHMSMPSFLSSAATRETKEKVKNLMYRGDFLLDATSEMQKSRFKSESNLQGKLEWLSPYKPTRITEFMNQGTLVIARLMSVKVTKNDGTVSNLFDALDENLNIKPEYSDIADKWNWTSGELMTKETSLIRKLIKDTHGDYSEIGKQYAKRKIAGRMAMFFKTWLPNALKARFAEEKYDLTYDMTIKGRYRSYTPGTAALAGATVGSWLAPGLGTVVGYGIGMTVGKLWGNDVHNKNVAEDVKDSFTSLGKLMQRLIYSKLKHFNSTFGDKLDSQFEGEFDEVDAANLRANFQELQFMLTLILVYFIAKAALYDDDEDKKNQLVHNFIINQIIKIQNDLVFYTSPQTPGTLMEQLIPITTIIDQTFSIMNSANKAMFNVELTSNEDTLGENLGELLPRPFPSTKVLERTYNEPTILRKLFEEE